MNILQQRSSMLASLSEVRRMVRGSSTLDHVLGAVELIEDKVVDARSTLDLVQAGEDLRMLIVRVAQ